METRDVKPLLAETFSRPVMLLWAMILPQAALVLINFSFWSLVHGEMSAAQSRMALEVFALEAALLLAGIGVAGVCLRLKKKVHLIVCGVLFFAHIAYLWLITAWLDGLLPTTVTVWILPPEEVLYYQYILMMPVLFYTGLRLACFTAPVQTPIDVSITVATLIMVPLCSYFFVTVFSSLFWNLDIPSALLIIPFIGATAISMMAFLRLLTYIYLWLNQYKAGHLVLLLAVGVAGPLGGLALNRGIPFPCDFQSVSVYLLALINGGILLLTFKEGSKQEVLGWFLRCVMYPFSLYFFLVFLPFLPLSLIAMIAMGSGFLILTPTALFIVHTRKLVDEGRRVVRQTGRAAAILLFAAGFAVMPGVIAVRAVLDKQSLMQAVDAVYSPDYTATATGIDPESVQRSLLKLRDMKDGIFLPFISTFYNTVVFNGMVLPDYKMNEMYLMFSGQEMPEGESFRDFSFGRRMDFRNRSIVMPERNVAISDIQITEAPDGDFVRASIQLTLTNQGRWDSEFVSTLRLGEGVMVSGYWLNVGDEKKAGSIFEKKAAMWVYHMIRDMTRKDPGLLIYKTNDLLQLSVYPFAEGERRLTGIELIYPAGMRPSVTLGDTPLDIGSAAAAETDAVLFIQTAPHHATAIVSEHAMRALPTTRRTPYLHFIVDRSIAAKDVFESFGKRMGEIARAYGKADLCRITLANYETAELTEGPVSIDEIDRLLRDSAAAASLDFQGAFCYSRAIQKNLLDFRSTSAQPSNSEYYVPIFVVVSAPGSKAVSIGELSPFGRIVPDVGRYYIAHEDGTFTARGFNGDEHTASAIEPPAPVVLLRCGASIAACVKGTGWGFADFVGGGDSTPEVYAAEGNPFAGMNNVKTLTDDTVYAKGLAAWAMYREMVFAPHTTTAALPEVVLQSRACGVMVPSTSYIVLENTAQLEMLKRKEKQGLSANQALEFDEFMESPAPPAILLAPVALVLLMKLRRRNAAEMRR